MSGAYEGHDRGREGTSITRETLASGAHLADMRATACPGLTFQSDDELDASLVDALATHKAGASCWLFGYGSLMWNPAFRFVERRLGTLRGFERQFCLQLLFGRGTPDRPGLMLALDEGEMCQGVLFRIAAGDVIDELRLVWRREMAAGSYLARWVEVESVEGRVRAITFTANKAHDRYVSGVSEAAIAATLAIATGRLGSCAAYLQQTVEALRLMKVDDPPLERLWELVRSQDLLAGDEPCRSTASLSKTLHVAQ